MSDLPVNPGSIQAEQQEINRLRAQVRELQSRLARRLNDPYKDEAPEDRSTRRRRGDARMQEMGDVARDLPVRLADEASKFLRGMTFAYLEQLRVAADAANIFADEVTNRNRPQPQSTADDPDCETDDRRTISDLAASLPRDVSAAFVRGLDRLLDIPSAGVHSYHEAYQETEEEAEPTLRERRREAGSRHESPISSEPMETREPLEPEVRTPRSGVPRSSRKPGGTL